MENYIERFFHAGTSVIKRSTALQPLLVVLALVAFALIAAVAVGADRVVTYILLVAVVGTLGACACAYFRLLRDNPDALRSEKYNLAKMALERSWRGDDTTGPIEIIDHEEDYVLRLSSQSDDEEES